MRYEVVLVTYRSRALAEALLRRLAADTPVVIVDNAQGHDRVDEMAARRPGTRYLPGPAEGFARAANLGARTSEAEFVLFVNPDSAPEPDQLEALVAGLEQDSHLIAIGATTVLADGRVELGVGGWEPTVWRCLAHALGLHVCWPTAGVYARPVPGRPLDLDWLSGACLAVRRADFLALGGFDERFFVYNEDMAFGRRAREAGWGLALRTDVLVPHLGAGSGEAKPRMFQMRGASMMQYVGSFNGPAATAMIKMALSVGTLGRRVRAHVEGRPDLARAHAAYLTGIWRGAPDMT